MGGGVNCLPLQRNIKKYRQIGLLDKNITITFLEGKVPLEDLFELLKEKLGSKYEVKFLKKGNTAAQFLGTGSANDRIFIAKNAYHRTLITTSYAPMTDDMSREDTYLGFDRSTMKGWLKMLYSEGGWIGQWIIKTIYGSNQEFDTDILDAINSKYPIQQKDQNVGISALWKKNN